MDMSNNNQEIIKRKFDALVRRSEADPDLKLEIMKTVRLMENIGAITDLFTVKYLNAEIEFLNEITKEK